MTEKRFTFADGFKIVAIKDNGQIMNSRQVCELLNALNDENEELLQFKYKAYRIIRERIELLESDYNKAVKAGMPSNSVYGEIELLEDLKEELGK